MKFELLDAFRKKEHIVDLELCRVLMEDKEFPWILLVPMRDCVTQMNHLREEDAIQLIKEINISSDIMEELFETDRLNVAAIGNKTSQLHVHIISRRMMDSLWPNTVWGQKMATLSDQERDARASCLRDRFCQKFSV
ncbi:MAG: HIT domain-containing protein [Holosporales bacterium]|jgi:diadenosine tetraphosphate (Ap4A) HIT family hydrolase|nr:HIT domain-containing protein [Holosporales bacterium]